MRYSFDLTMTLRRNLLWKMVEVAVMLRNLANMSENTVLQDPVNKRYF